MNAMQLFALRDAWQQHAACRDLSPALFFPEKWNGNYIPPEAAAACARCPVARECLDYAMRRGERGIWAGTTELQRIALRGQYTHPRRNSIAVSHG